MIEFAKQERRARLPPFPIGLCETFDDYEKAKERFAAILRMDCDARLERKGDGWSILWCYTQTEKEMT